MFISGEVITTTKLEDKNDCNQVSGYCGLNSLGIIPFTRFYNGFINNISWATRYDISGNWYQFDYLPQIIYDPNLTGTGTTIFNGIHTDLDKIEWDYKFIAGSYNIIITYLAYNNCGILKLWHGGILIGTKDTYDSNLIGNKSVTFTYILLQNSTNRLSIQVSEKNILSRGYKVFISKIEIVRV